MLEMLILLLLGCCLTCSAFPAPHSPPAQYMAWLWYFPNKVSSGFCVFQKITSHVFTTPVDKDTGESEVCRCWRSELKMCCWKSAAGQAASKEQEIQRFGHKPFFRNKGVPEEGLMPEMSNLQFLGCCLTCCASAYSGKVFRITLTTLIVTLLAPLLVATLLLESPINPEPFSYKEPPLLAGPLEPNLKLRQAERLFDGQLIGPESIAHLGEVIFTGTADGQILKISDGQIHTLARIGKLPCGTREDEPTCGRPLGIRVGPNGTLFVADAYYGLFEINPVTGEVEMLVSAQKIIQGRRMAFVNDLSITQDGRKIYFTDSSSKWQRRDNRYLVMEGTADGRLMEYDTVTKQVEVLMDDLRFANGVQLSPAEDYVLVTETTMARIRRYHISGLRKGGHDIFFDNLPGFPDNIRPSSSGGYWVGMAVLRPNPGFSMMDFLAPRPWLKNLIFKLFSQEMTMKFVPKYGLVLELNEDGSINRSFHDPHGVVVPAVSEADEHDGYLYLGSYYSPFLCRLDLNKV